MTDQAGTLMAQVNALSQAWLHLAAAVEKAGVVRPGQLQAPLRELRWDAPWDADARALLSWLCDQLDEASQARAADPDAGKPAFRHQSASGDRSASLRLVWPPRTSGTAGSSRGHP